MPLKILQSSGRADRFNRLQETTKHVDQGNHTVDGFKKQQLFSFSLFPGSMSVLYLICDLVLDSIALLGPAHRRDPWVPHLHQNLRMAWSLLSHQQMQRPGSFQDCRNSTMTTGRSCLELWGVAPSNRWEWIWEWILGTRNVSILDFVSSWLPAGPLRSKTGGIFVFGWGCQPGREPGNHHLCQASEGNTSSVVPQASNPSRS